MKKRKLKILVTAGPTREPLDPTRFISNYSTGIFGFEIATVAKKRGHKVTLISGPTFQKDIKGIKTIRVETALQMQKASLREFKNCDCLVMNAAVCDYRPHKFSKNKIKKGKQTFYLKLVKNPDILKSLAKHKGYRILVGFSLETKKVVKNAFNKLKDKNLSLIVASQVTKSHQPFGEAKITVYIIDRKGIYKKKTKVTKKNLAGSLLDSIERLWYTSFLNR